MAGLGITKIKVTGGEALTRRALVDLIRQLKLIPGIQQVTLTSNGILLAEYIDSLVSAGLDAVNISMDTLNPDTFTRISRSGGFEQLVSVINRIRGLPIPVKINCVPIPGINDSEIAAIAGLAKDKAAAVRFIELMPLGRAGDFQMLTQEKIMAEIVKVHGQLTPFSGGLGNGPALYYSLEGFAGKIGFISPMSHIFCETCNRLRLSASGQLIACLSGTSGLNIQALLRGSAGRGQNPLSAAAKNITDEELANAIRQFILQKPLCHLFAETKQIEKEMFRIGG
jgi:cyclic pyranopterin phosphate synthase